MVKRRYNLVVLAMMVLPVLALAEDPNAPLALDQWLQMVFSALSGFKGAQWHVVVGGVLTLLIAALRVSPFQKWWDKLGRAKVLLAPALALIAATISFVAQGNVSFAGVLAALLNGALAVSLAELGKAVLAFVQPPPPVVPAVEDKPQA